MTSNSNYKKNILIIRSANFKVIDDLISYINNQYDLNQINIFMMIQRSAKKLIQEQYQYIQYIEKDDKAFKYKSFKENDRLQKIFKNIKYDEVYIPSSYYSFVDMYEVFKIASKVKSDKYILFNSRKEVVEKRLNLINICYHEYMNKIFYFLKVILAIISIALIYLITYPYNLIRNRFYNNL